MARYYVIARVVGSPNSLKRWKELLVHLVKVSATEPKGISYYWGQDLDGEPNTLWGLEGYTDADGFFNGHPASDVFKTQMAFVDSEKLLAEDYDLHHYDFVGGWLTRKGDPEAHSTSSHVAVVHVFTREGERDRVIKELNNLAEATLQDAQHVTSCGIFREVNDPLLVTLWLRTPAASDLKDYQSSAVYQKTLGQLENSGAISRIEQHNSQTFNGHIDLTPLCEQ